MKVKPWQIAVIVIGPGPVRTPIWAKAEASDLAGNTNSPYYPMLRKARELSAQLEKSGLPPEKLGALVHKVLTIRSPKVRYAIVPDPVEAWVAQILPKRIVDRITAHLLGIKRLSRPT